MDDLDVFTKFSLMMEICACDNICLLIFKVHIFMILFMSRIAAQESWMVTRNVYLRDDIVYYKYSY